MDEQIRVPDEVRQAMGAARRLVLAGHVTPDTDCLASMFALWAAVRQADIAAAVVLPAGSSPQRLAFLGELVAPELAGPEEACEADVVVVVDTAKPQRVNAGELREELLRPGRVIVNIDHHATNTRFGTANWVVAEASSTSELVYHLVKALDWRITPPMASLLYAGIHSDTGGFSLPNTTSGALQTAAELIPAGADVVKVGEKLCRSQQRSDFDLLRTVYRNTVIAAGGRIAYSTLTHEEITSCGCTAADIDDQVSVPRSLGGIRIAMLFSEGVPGKVRINFRGEGGTDVLELAKRYGGGGHVHSAGAIVPGNVEEVAAAVVAEAERYLDDQER